MNEVKTMVQIPLDLLDGAIRFMRVAVDQVLWTKQGKAARNAVEGVIVAAERCKESQLQVMYHREFVPADNYDGLLKQARALQSITKTQQASLAFARKDAYDLSLQLLHANNDRLKSELEANSILTSEVERLKGILNNLRAHAIESVGSNDMEIPACIWDIAMDEMEKIGV